MIRPAKLWCDTSTTAASPTLRIGYPRLVRRPARRGGCAGLNKLGELLKQAQRENKTSDKEIQSVRQTLRSLQSVRI